MIEVNDRRSACPIANSLEILGDRWTLLIIRDLMFTNRCEFGHFLSANEGISTNILSERLERLQCFGLVTKQPHPTHGRKFIYELTPAGLALAPTLIEFISWGHSHITDTFAPDVFIDMLKNHREELLRKVAAREPIVEVDLASPG